MHLLFKFRLYCFGTKSTNAYSIILSALPTWLILYPGKLVMSEWHKNELRHRGKKCTSLLAWVSLPNKQRTWIPDYLFSLLVIFFDYSRGRPLHTDSLAKYPSVFLCLFFNLWNHPWWSIPKKFLFAFLLQERRQTQMDLQMEVFINYTLRHLLLMSLD